MTVYNPPSVDERDLDLAYLANRAFDPQWRLFLESLASELFENFSAEEAKGFFRQIGVRIGRQLQPGPSATVPELEQALNATWQLVGWGHIQLAVTDNGMFIMHRAYPGSFTGAGHDAWRYAFAAVLEGVYTQWLQTQGGDPGMRAQYQDDGTPNALVFRFAF